jgi:hypothetical protein
MTYAIIVYTAGVILAGLFIGGASRANQSYDEGGDK